MPCYRFSNKLMRVLQERERARESAIEREQLRERGRGRKPTPGCGGVREAPAVGADLASRSLTPDLSAGSWAYKPKHPKAAAPLNPS